MAQKSSDVVIIGAGMVGLSLAYQIKKRFPDLSVLVIEKESKIGLHSSGRNSGVLHAGIYYPPNTLKAKVCVEGAKRLRQWCESEKLPILKCGKVIVAQSLDLDSQLDVLLERGIANGAEVRLISEKEFKQRVPDGRTASGRALWSPNTCVVKPALVLQRLFDRLKEKGVKFQFSTIIAEVSANKNLINITNKSTKEKLYYGHLFNTAGLQADRVAKEFGLSEGFTLLPFKGIYWKLDKNAPFSFNTNLYPVPDLNVPFLGVHVTPSPDGTISLGPTAIPALGRENYQGFEAIEPLMALGFCGDLLNQWIKNSGGFRKYAREQALHGFKPLFLKAAKLLVPKMEMKHLVPSDKVGIRAQLYDRQSNNLVQDFKLEQSQNTTHVLNAISPAFTASFSLADLILNQTKL